MQQTKARVHRISNLLQAVLGYMELENYDQALEHLHKTIVESADLGKELCAVAGSVSEADDYIEDEDDLHDEDEDLDIDEDEDLDLDEDDDSHAADPQRFANRTTN